MHTCVSEHTICYHLKSLLKPVVVYCLLATMNRIKLLMRQLYTIWSQVLFDKCSNLIKTVCIMPGM